MLRCSLLAIDRYLIRYKVTLRAMRSTALFLNSAAKLETRIIESIVPS